MKVLACGNAFDGLALHGPFEDGDQAVRYGEEFAATLDSWEVVDVTELNWNDTEARPKFVTTRERDTIMAALRLWQHCQEKDLLNSLIPSEQANMLTDIAENGRTGDDAALTNAEIDELIEDRLNGG